MGEIQYDGDLASFMPRVVAAGELMHMAGKYREILRGSIDTGTAAQFGASFEPGAGEDDFYIVAPYVRIYAKSELKRLGKEHVGCYVFSLENTRPDGTKVLAEVFRFLFSRHGVLLGDTISAAKAQYGFHVATSDFYWRVVGNALFHAYAKIEAVKSDAQ